MRQTLLTLAVIAAVGACAILACNSNSSASKNTEGIAATIVSQDSVIEHGRYLVTLMGCNDCHSPKKMGPMGPEIDSAHMLSGHPSKMPLGKISAASLKEWVLFNPTQTAIAGPWGVSFAANLTSDASGIGNWSEAQFFTALRKGKFKGMEGGRSLLPPMPWQTIGAASDADLHAIFTYLKSTQPVENVVPAPITPNALALIP